MLTQEQFDSICSYVRERLEKEEKFTIHHSTFEKMFGLKRPYYQEMIRLAELQKVDFDFNAAYKKDDPIDVITFYL